MSLTLAEKSMLDSDKALFGGDIRMISRIVFRTESTESGAKI